MNYYEKDWSQKRKDKKHFQEQKSQAFRCGQCRAFVVVNEYIGTANRNHCNSCLWSKHVDNKKGDRNSQCQAGMEPIGLTMKWEGSARFGELMLIHLCRGCSKISINRIAGDDDVYKILDIFAHSQTMHGGLRFLVEQQEIMLLGESDREEIEIQLFGK